MTALDKRLRTCGKKTFLDYYKIIPHMERSEAIELLQANHNYTLNSARAKVSQICSIVNLGQEKEALLLIHS